MGLYSVSFPGEALRSGMQPGTLTLKFTVTWGERCWLRSLVAGTV